MIAVHKQEIDGLHQQLEDVNREVMESSKIRHEQEKYDDRVKFIKKMHEEELAEVRRINRNHEDSLEQQIVAFRRDYDQLFIKAKEEAREEEKRKRAKF